MAGCCVVAMNLRVPYNARDFLSSCVTTGLRIAFFCDITLRQSDSDVSMQRDYCDGFM